MLLEISKKLREFEHATALFYYSVSGPYYSFIWSGSNLVILPLQSKEGVAFKGLISVWLETEIW